MNVFQHVLWGYELSFPSSWTHQTTQDVEALAAIPQALQADYAGPCSGHLLVRAEWNCTRQPIEPLWTRHIGMLAGMLGARQVGSAPWRMAGATGLEAEIVLPKRENRRLWTGILAFDFSVLHFVVTHAKEERSWFEPIATQIISSLRFLKSVPGLATNNKGLPLPPERRPVDPENVLKDIDDPVSWEAYDNQAGIDALQAFYWREAPIHGWQVEEYVPFPSSSDLGFARLRLHRAGQRAILGLLPYGDDMITSKSPARVLIKYV
jgi:hypothetical protein